MNFDIVKQKHRDSFFENTFKFRDICEVHNGRAYKKNELLDSGKYTVLRVGNFFSSDNWYYSDLELDDNKYCDDGDLLFAWSASFGPKIWSGGKVIYHYHIWKLNPIETVSKNYLYYWLLYSKNKMLAGVHGSVMGHLTKDGFEKQEISLPRLLEQKAIARILSTLDEKIELNNKINKTLENMAQAIFKHWFIDFEFPNEEGEPYKSSGGEMVESELGMIPKGWEVNNLEKIIEFNPRENMKKAQEYKFVEMAALSNNLSNIEYWTKRELSGGSRFRNGDTLLARITPCLENGKTAFVDFLADNEMAFGSTEFIIMRAKELSNKIFVYCLARDTGFRAHAIKSMSGSSGRQRVQLDLLKSYKMAQSPKRIYHSFGEITESLFAKISSSNRENYFLCRIRDLLLPKLMSGEIRVPLGNEDEII